MINFRKRRAVIQCVPKWITGVAVLGASPSLWACEGEDPVVVVEKFANNLFDLFGRLNGQNDSYASRRAALRKVVDDRFDYKAMSEAAMAIAIPEMNSKQLSRLYKTSRDLLVEVLLGFFSLYSEKVQFFVLGMRESRSGNRKMLETMLISKSGLEIAIRWDLIDAGGKCKVIDVRVLGVSLVNDVAQDSHNAYERGGVSELFKVLDRKIRKSRREYPD